MQRLVSIPALLPVLWIVEFWNGNFNVKLQFFVLRFLKKFPRVFFRISHITCTCHDLQLKRFWCWSWKGLGVLGGKCENQIFPITFSFELLSSICFQIWIILFQYILKIMVRGSHFWFLKGLLGPRKLQKGGCIKTILNFYWIFLFEIHRD